MFKSFLKDVSITRVPESATRTENTDNEGGGGGTIDPDA